MTQELMSKPEIEENTSKRPLVVPLEEDDHAALLEIGKRYGLQKATYARLIILSAINDPERFAPSLVVKG